MVKIRRKKLYPAFLFPFRILPVRVILQGDIAEYYPASDMLSTNETSNIAYGYKHV